MRKPGLVFLAVSVMLINACGRVTTMKQAGGNEMMSEVEAMETLSQVPLESTSSATNSAPETSSIQLAALIQQLVDDGQVQLPSGVKTATNGEVDLTTLNNIFSLLNSGGTTNLLGLANGLVNMNNGDTSGTGGKLSGILSILQAVAPIIAVVAPQFAPIIAALTTIIPLVVTFINLFKKKSAALFMFQPVWA